MPRWSPSRHSQVHPPPLYRGTLSFQPPHARRTTRATPHYPKSTGEREAREGSLRNSSLLGPYSRTVSRALGRGMFLMIEVPLSSLGEGWAIAHPVCLISPLFM